MSKLKTPPDQERTYWQATGVGVAAFVAGPIIQPDASGLFVATWTAAVALIAIVLAARANS